MTQNYINHIALVLDASGSMDRLAAKVVEVADQQISHLAQRSRELDQETRITVYTFDYPSNIQCRFYDKDVLRLPSLKGVYKPNGQTALIDATLRALDDLSKTPELYGDHAFLTYVLTDGQENASRNHLSVLHTRLQGLKDNWTIACFVPDALGVSEAKKFGFPKDNIAVWDTSAKGMVEAGETIRRATDNYMTQRAIGIRGSKNLFQLDASKVELATQVLKPLTFGQYRLLKVNVEGEQISSFIERQFKRPYRLGEAYYQLTKPVKVQAGKNIAVYKGGNLYTGPSARSILGLPDYEVKVEPSQFGKMEIYIQSTSVNRKLVSGTNVVIL